MKVSELIATLLTMNPDHMVVLSGYEGGVNEVTSVNEVNINLDVNTAWYYGNHEIQDDGKTPGVYIY